MRTICLTALMLAVITGAMTTTKAQDNVQAVKTFTTRLSKDVGLNYLLFLPEGCKVGGEKRWPLMLFLHGAGERGTSIWKVAVHGPPKIVPKKADFPFILVSPQCPDGACWADDAVLALLDDCIARLPVDTHRVYLTGLSMGGFGTWSLGTRYPERFAAIAPICGGGDTIPLLLASPDKRKTLQSLGVWAFHGAKDGTVPLAESERMVSALKRAGCKEVELTVYPEANHDSWTATYDNPALYEWFLKHRR
jgi:predicted peptidase